MTTKPTVEKEQETKKQDGHCSCGAVLKLCHICHAMYCPVCDQYHIEQCREAMRP